ncbi:sulfotransferase family protein [Leisingera sp. S232]|uniref:sulfotransferase family protein n=1 Tax=Leisingera sp. S232 TaxID=3415132 RepID=UPI00086897CF|nr:hypothetical protein AB838_21765 [Rhodobacteraceae bacterium (ex Bugula neritina AB1)]
MTQTPVFLFCSERSGSNLISMIAGTHSQFYSLPPFHFGRLALLNLHETLQEGVESAAWQQICKRSAARIKTLLGPQEAEAAQAWLAARSRIDAAELARFLYQDSVPAASGKRVFVKENNLHRLLFFILQAFPDAKFVFQVRDPRDYLASAKALRAKEGATKFGNNRDAARIWREDQEGGLHALALLGPERVFLHRYEDLLTAPEALLKRMCGFLEVDFEPGMLDFHQTDQAAALATSHKQRANVSKPLMSGNFAKYRSALTRKEIRQIENRLGDLMQLFGYPLDLAAPGKQHGSGLLGRFARQPLLKPLDYGAWDPATAAPAAS